MADLNDNILGWIASNNFVTERGHPVEFDEHYFLIEPFANWNNKQVCMKSAQVGWSTFSILKTFYACLYKKFNCIYTLPTADDMKDFVPSKANAMIKNNPILLKDVGDCDSVEKKEISGHFIWYRGTHNTKAAVSHTSDLNVYDELDLSNQSVIDMYASRLQFSKYKGEWSFSNPSVPNFGVSKLYDRSNQKRWMIWCSKCGHTQDLQFEKNVDQEGKKFICSKCKQELSEEDRHDGEWVAAKRDEEMDGYHVNQLMCSWVTAKELVHAKETKTPQYFYNMMLGIPWVDKDDQVTRETITKNIVKGQNSHLRNAMGVDVGYKWKHFVLGNHEGIFKVGSVQTWDEIEALMKKYNAITVVDGNPDFYSRELPEKYKGQAYCCFYKQDREKRDVVRWGNGYNRGFVYVDRNQFIQMFIDDMNRKNVKFYTREEELEEFIEHWTNIYRVVEENSFGIPQAKWEKKSRDDHLVHASVYWKIALTKVPKFTSSTYTPPTGVVLSHEVIDGTIPADRIPTFEAVSKDWRYI